MAQAVIRLDPYDPFSEDALDRRAALAAAVAGRESENAGEITERAAEFYTWLRGRDTLRPYRLAVSFSPPTKQGARAMADLNLNLLDNENDNGTVTPKDAKGFPTTDANGPVTWTNDNPEVVTITPSEDGLSVSVSALAPGDAVLHVTDSVLTDNILVHVDPGPVDHLDVAFDSATPQTAPVSGDGGAAPSSPPDQITTPTGAVVEPNPQASGEGSSAANDGLTGSGPAADAPPADSGADAGSGSDGLAVEAADAGSEEQPA